MSCRWKGCPRQAIPPGPWHYSLCFEHWCELENYDPVNHRYLSERPEEEVIILPGEEPLDLRDITLGVQHIRVSGAPVSP